MLYSRELNFVFSKTYKTAGTSVEVFLQQFCARPEELAQSDHASPCVISERGIVGYRGAPGAEVKFWNHMSLADIRERLGKEYDNAVKVTTIRNPYDAVISAFHFREVPVEEARRLKTDNIAALRNAFAAYVPRISTQRDKFFIGERLEIETFIRFESLAADLAAFCQDRGLGIDEASVRSALPRHKISAREGSGLEFSDYFTEEALELVNARLGYWFELGGYMCADSLGALESDE